MASANNLIFTITLENKAETALNSLKKQVKSLKSGLQQIGSGVSDAASNLTSFKDKSSSAEKSVNSLGETVKRIVGYFGGFQIVNSVFRTITSTIDQAVTRIDTMDLFQQKMAMITGSADLATEALDHLKESTKGTPYALDIAAKGVQNLVLRGLDTQNAVSSVDIWMDAVSAYGQGTNEQFESVLDAISKMRTKGTVEMRYLNRLFAAGINPVKMYADATGQAATDVQTALSNKEISASEFLDTVEKAMREGTNGVLQVQGMAKNLATTWTATLANMRIAIARGWATLIDGIDDAFKVINPKKGVKALFAGFGTTVENILGGIATAIKAVLPPILQTAKNAFDYWKNYYFQPLYDYFQSFIKPVKDNLKQIKDAFNVKGDVDISGLTSALDYKGNGSLRDALLEVVMSWENLKKTTRDTWSGLNPQPAEGAKPDTFKFNLDKSVLDFLTKLNEAIGSVQARIPQLLTSWKSLTDSFKNTFGSIVEIFLTIAGGVAEFALQLGSIVVPPAMDLLSKGFSFLSTILNELSNAVKRFTQNKLPQIINNIVSSLQELSQTPFVQSLAKAFETLGERISFTLKTIQDYSAFLRNEKDFTFDPKNIDQSNIIRIFQNIQKMFDGIVEGVKPIGDAFRKVFDTEIGEGKAVNGFSKILEIVADLSDIVATEIPKVVRNFSNFAAKVITFIKPVGEYLWNLLVNNIIPFAVSVGRAFFSVLSAISPLIAGFGELILAVAAFVIPPALTLFTNICNWIAEHADLVVSAIIGIVTAFAMFKTITAVSTVLEELKTVLLDGVIPAVSNFYKIMTTEGIAAAITSIMNPVVIIPLAIAALIGLAAGLIYLYTTSDTARDKINKFVAGFLTMTTGIQVGADDVAESFKQIGDWIKDLNDKLTGLLTKIDEFFDKFDGFRNILKTILKGPGMNYGDWLGSNEDTSPETLFNPGRDLGFNEIPNMKIQIPNLMGNTEQWRATAQEATDAVKQSIQQDIPEVQANGQQTIQTLYSALTDTTNSIGTVDISPITANIDNLPAEGYGAGSGLGLNLASGVTSSTEAVNQTVAGMSGIAIDTLSSTLAGDPTFQTGVAFASTFQTGFQAQAETVYMAMSTFVNNCLMIIQAGFNNPESVIPSTIASSLTQLMSQITAEIEMYCTEINTKLTETYNQFLNSVDVTFQDFVKKHDTTIGQIFPSFQNTIKSHLDDAVQKYTDFSSSVHTKLDELATYHYTVGTSMMNSLKNGISDTMPQVVSIEGELVQKLKETFEKGMGINSPADKWIWYGQMLMAGLLIGLDDSKVQKFIGTTIDHMNESFKNGNFNADQTVNFLSEKGTLDLIGKVNGLDMSGVGEQQIAYPLAGTLGTISSYFGNRESPGGIGSTNHQGMDLATAQGTPILSALGGTVTTASWYGGYGNAVVVDSGNGLEIVYGHMSQILATQGQQVNKGAQIGLVGSTGNSTGPHLHFEMRQNGTAIDPYPYLQGAGITAGNTLSAVLQNAYNKKYHPELLASSSSHEGNVAYDVSAGAAQWSNLVLQALAMLGQPASLLQGILYAIDSESSGNPNAINLTDSNAAKGQNSRGLLQVIPSTFEMMRNPSLSADIYDPLANIYAGLNWMMYTGGIDKIIRDRAGGWFGYAVGTRNVPFDMPAMIHKGEAIIPASQNPYSSSGGDYLADLFSNAFGDVGINELGFDLTALDTGSSSNNINNNLNNVFNITNHSDVDADRNVGNIESALHKMLQDGMMAGSSR